MLRIIVETSFSADAFKDGDKGSIIHQGSESSIVAFDNGHTTVVDNNQFKITAACTDVYVEKRFVISSEVPYCEPQPVECGYIGTLEEAKEKCHQYRKQHYPVGSQDILTIYEVQSDGTTKKVQVLDPIPV